MGPYKARVYTGHKRPTRVLFKVIDQVRHVSEGPPLVTPTL